MRVTVDGGSLKKAVLWGTKGLGDVKASANDSSSLAVLSYEDNQLRIETYNGVKYFRAIIPVSGGAAGEKFMVKVPGTDLTNIVSVLGSEGVSIDAGGDSQEVVFSEYKGEYSVPTSALRTAAFPNVGSRVGSMAYADLQAHANRHSSVAASSEVATAGGAALGSVNLEFQPSNGVVRFVSTNRYILVQRDVPYVPDVDGSQGVDDVFTVCVPGALLRSMLPSNIFDGDVDMHFSDDMFGVSSGDFYGAVAVANASPLLYGKMVERPSGAASLVVECAKFFGAVRDILTVNKTASDKTLQVVVTPDCVEVSSMSDGGVVAGRGKIRVTPVQSEFPASQEIVFKVDGAYLTSVLNSATSKNVALLVPEAVGKPVMVLETVADGLSLDDSYNSVFAPKR